MKMQNLKSILVSLDMKSPLFMGDFSKFKNHIIGYTEFLTLIILKTGNIFIVKEVIFMGGLQPNGKWNDEYICAIVGSYLGYKASVSTLTLFSVLL